MKGVTEAKGLANLSTATTKRIRARPPQRGTAHLEMYLLATEKQRLEQELVHLDKRRLRIHRHLNGIVEELARLQQVARQDETGDALDGAAVQTTPLMPSPSQPESRWKAIPFEY